MIESKIKSVITGDVVNSSKLSSKQKDIVFEYLDRFVRDHSHELEKQFLIYRGDSIQGVLQDCKLSLRYIVYLKALINSIKLNEGDRSPKVDVRLSVGLGEIDYVGRSPLDSDGAAFHRSGRALDAMKKDNRLLMITTDKDEDNDKWNVIIQLLEEVVGGWSIASAELVSLLLWTDNEKKVSEILGISQPAVNLRKKHAGWDSIKKTIEYFENQYADK